MRWNQRRDGQEKRCNKNVRGRLAEVEFHATNRSTPQVFIRRQGGRREAEKNKILRPLEKSRGVCHPKIQPQRLCHPPGSATAHYFCITKICRVEKAVGRQGIRTLGLIDLQRSLSVDLAVRFHSQRPGTFLKAGA